MLLIGKKSKTTTIFCQDSKDYMGDASTRPTKKFESKGESIVEYKLGRILDTEVSTKLIISQNLFIIPKNRVMSRE